MTGFTCDSGLATRIENLMACTERLPNPDGTDPGDERDVRIVRIRWPVNGCGIFSPVGATAKDKLAVSCPYRRSAMALPHMNVISLDILFEDMEECIFRNLSSRLAGANNDIVHSDSAGGIKVELLTTGNAVGVKGPQLHVEYLRLGSWRGIPQSASLQCFRIAVHEPTSKTTGGGIPQ